MKSGVLISAALAAFSLLSATDTAAHARWRIDGTIPVPRSTADGIKTGACGNVPRTTTPTTFTPGQIVELNWEETINHPGSYRIAFSPANDTGFDSNVLLTVTDTLGAETPLPHRYRATVTIPMQTCEACTLQLIQYMTESNPPSLYYSCADIRIAASGGTPPPPPPPPPAPPPSPPPPPAPPPSPPPTQSVPPDMKEFAQQLLDDFTNADADANNSLSMAEVQTLYPAVTTSQFNTFDASGDGLITRRELDRYIAPPVAASATTTQEEYKPGAASTDALLLLILAAGLGWRLRYSVRDSAN